MSHIAYHEIKQEQESKQRTNAERYREQLATDEGLAEFLMKAHDGEIHIPFCQDKGPCALDDIDPMGEGCKACMMEWLNKPAEEGGQWKT